RPRHGVDHDLAPARLGGDAHAFGLSRQAQGGAGRGRRGGTPMSTPADPILAVEHLSMRFGALVAGGDLSFAPARGHITALLGPNGAGKTTVFNCITVFYHPSVGMIRLAHADGTAYLLERLLDFRIAKLARVARTFQNIRLFAGMTVLENLLIAQHNLLMK